MAKSGDRYESVVILILNSDKTIPLNIENKKPSINKMLFLFFHQINVSKNIYCYKNR